MTSAAKTTKQVLAGIVLMVLAGLGPWILLSLLGWPDAAVAAILPAVALTITCVTGSGWRAGFIVVVPFAVLSGLATWASPSPWLAAIVLAVGAFLRGYAARFGMHDALMLTVIALGFLVAVPPSFTADTPAPLIVAAVTLGSGLWASTVIYALRAFIPNMPRVRVAPSRVLAFSIVLALLVGVATFLVVRFNLGQTGGWIILTILVVYQPHLGSGIKKAGSRALGTIAGFGITIVVGLFFPTGPILYVLGFIFIVITFLFILQNRPYWMYAMVLTPAVVLLDSANSAVGIVARERLVATIIGVACTLLVMLALVPVERYFEKKLAAPVHPPQSG